MVDEEPKRRKIVIDLDENPELAEILRLLTRSSKKTKTLTRASARTNAISGENANPRRSLRRGFQPQR